jgi:hypothetical protein
MLGYRVLTFLVGDGNGEARQVICRAAATASTLL